MPTSYVHILLVSDHDVTEDTLSLLSPCNILCDMTSPILLVVAVMLPWGVAGMYASLQPQCSGADNLFVSHSMAHLAML